MNVLVYALMLIGVAPSGWQMVYEGQRGLDAYVYANGDQVVLAIQGTETVTDLLAIPARRIVGYNSRYLELAGEFGVDAVVGHSAAGGLASWIAHELDVQSVTFNAAVPTDQALLNDGAKQTNVVVTGDNWGDPSNGRARLAGTYIYLPSVPESVNAHAMSTVVDILTSL